MTDSVSPRALHIVLNGVVEDSRVLKCAWSLGNAGWDVLVCGASPNIANDELGIGYARIRRLSLKIVVSQHRIAAYLRMARRYKRALEARLLPNRKPAVPNLKRAVAVITPIALELKPDVIHAHDYTALPIAGALVETLRRQGVKTALIYDAHEYVPGVSHLKKPLMKVYSAEERKYVKLASAVLSVSEGMSDLLIPHLNLTTRPEIVANDPLVDGQQPSERDLRRDCGLAPKVPLLVYSGAVAPQRGIATVLAGMRKMPDVHLALIANPKNQTVLNLQDEYSDLDERFHVQPYVPNSELVSYLSGADVGLIPIHHKLNHEISLITKFGEYMQARLPIIVSDVRTMSEEVKRLGIGEVFVAQNVEDFVRATRLVLDDVEKYKKRFTAEMLQERSWERQAEALVKVYERASGKSAQVRPHLPFKIVQQPQ